LKITHGIERLDGQSKEICPIQKAVSFIAFKVWPEFFSAFLVIISA
jgi:hypothetical protein